MKFDPVQLALISNRMSAIAAEMGIMLCRTAYSPNITERKDLSCATFDARGEMMAQAAHIPVRLGSTPLSVQAAIGRAPMNPGDVVVLNDPYAGGTHLPDVTMVTPVFVGKKSLSISYVVNRAHHADVGAVYPGSMPLSRNIFQEGIRIPPITLIRGGRIDQGLWDLLLNNVRTPTEREGDLKAQWGALNIGAERVASEARDLGVARLSREMNTLRDYLERLIRTTLREIPDGTFVAQDYLDDEGLGTKGILIRVAVTIRHDRAWIDFTGTAAQVEGCLNANDAITLFCVFYVLKTISRFPIPANGGIMRPIRVTRPEGSLVNARPPAPMARGNVETSQRIVDVLSRAFAKALPTRIPAASSGSMNNMAVAGTDPIRGKIF
jgi:N-methylhydantoinase B